MALNRFVRPLLVLLAAAVAVPLPSQDADAEPGRKPWEAVAPPAIVTIGAKAGDPGRIAVVFTLTTGPDGADRAVVEMLDPEDEVLTSRLLGKSKHETRTVEFAPAASGTYRFRITALRKDQAEGKVSATRAYDFSLPLHPPVFRVLNLGGGAAVVRWEPVTEADSYELSCRDRESGKLETLTTAGTEARFSGLVVGRKYAFTAAALRGRESAAAEAVVKTIRDRGDREWRFAWFGQSTKADLNTMVMIDADNLKFRLNSCSILPDGQIDRKGGKFTAFHDGVSYYYTVVDPEKENFELTATFTIDYINPVADGQEGFGLLAMDSLGEHTVNSRNHYTNSAGIIATKFEEIINEVKMTSKDTLGARFVSGITPGLLARGASAIAGQAVRISRAFSYEDLALVKAGDVYTLTLKKSNTGYHAVLHGGPAGRGKSREQIMYGPEKLLQLDSKHVYVGFAVARGCNATVSDINMRISDPAADPPAVPEPPELVPLTVRVDSPPTFALSTYPFLFTANADGRLTITGEDGRIIAADEPIRAGRDFLRNVELARGKNNFLVAFTPDPLYRPGKRQVLAAYDRKLRRYVESSAPVELTHSVVRHAYEGAQLHVTPGGSFLGKGTPDSPLDLGTALSFARPGQPIVLAGGTYRLSTPVIISRGADGSPAARRVLTSAPGERAVLDFSFAEGGFQLWGDYWRIADIDVRSTPDNVKGIQVGGHHNILENVNTYNCGDTGLQISGTSLEPPEKWPRHNLVLNCTSYDNFDPAANNADGFAAKLTCGEGNIFRGCLAYSNIDDGFDLYAKVETGPIGAVLIEDCLAYKNGSLSDGSGSGDGNGFKLGGDGIAVPHRIVNSIAFGNNSAGISSNSDPAIIALNCTSFGNGASNFAFYGKGSSPRTFQAGNNLSMKGGSPDQIREMPALASANNYFWNGAQSLNSLGEKLTADIFVSLDASILPGRRPDGSIDMKGFLVPNDLAPPGIGAILK